MKIVAIKNQIFNPLFKGAQRPSGSFVFSKNEQDNTDSESFRYSKKSALIICGVIAFSSLVLASLLLIFHKKVKTDKIKVQNEKELIQ